MTLVKEFILFILRKRSVAVSWVCVWISIHAACALASEPSRYTSRTWQMDDGLPQNIVQAVAQDGTGYLWIGTLRGLARFDGVRFTVFDSQNTPALKNSSITALCQKPRRQLMDRHRRRRPGGNARENILRNIPWETTSGPTP